MNNLKEIEQELSKEIDTEVDVEKLAFNMAQDIATRFLVTKEAVREEIGDAVYSFTYRSNNEKILVAASNIVQLEILGLEKYRPYYAQLDIDETFTFKENLIAVLNELIKRMMGLTEAPQEID